MNQPVKREQLSPQETFESTCKNFHYRFEAVTSSTINPSTISTFYEDALHKLISLTDDVVYAYIATTGSVVQGKELEDEAMEYYGLASIHETLIIIGERVSYLLELQDNLVKATNLSPEVFVPPNKEDKYLITGSGEGLEVKQLIPRLLTLGYILEHDLGLTVSDQEQVIFLQGEVTDKIMRKHPYIRVSINPLNRIVYLCDEEGNASFVFDKEKILEKVGKIELLDVMEKFRYKEMIMHDPTCGDVLRYGTQWRNNMNSLLTLSFEISKKKISEQQENAKINVVTSSDFVKMIPKKREGWESASSLKTKGIGNYSTIKSFAEQFRTEHPEWFENQKNASFIAEYYHPDLVAKVLEHFSKIIMKKEGWESSSSLSDKVIGNDKAVKSFAEQFRTEHPEWFEMQKNFTIVAEHYHPDFVEKIIEHFPSLDSIVSKMEGWESASSLSGKVTGQDKVIKAFAESFKKEHPEWFENQKNGSRVAEHYHPNLVAKILEHFPSIDFFVSKKEGWGSANSLTKKVTGNYKAIKSFTEQFRTEHPEWFEMQKNFTIVAEHYHPDLVAKILEYFSKIIMKKEGWESASSLVLTKKINRDYITVKAFAESFRKEHPEWFENQKNASVVAGYYHPDLVVKILEHFPDKKADIS